MKILSVILPQQRKQQTFCDATSGFPMKICLRNRCRNSVLMSLHHSDLGRASDWLKQIYHAAPPIRSTTLACVAGAKRGGGRGEGEREKR